MVTGQGSVSTMRASVFSYVCKLCMAPAVNPLLGYLLYKAAKWLAGMKKKLSQVLLCIYTLPTVQGH